MPDPIVEQLRAVLTDYDAMRAKSRHRDLSDLPTHERQALVTRSVASIRRIAGDRSSYAGEVDRILTNERHLFKHMADIMGVVKALHDDVAAGYTASLVELIHAATFADFLEMAQHLLDSGYKDAAAVIAGAALEAHLRLLCAKSAVPEFTERSDGKITPKKADAMNADLARAAAYSKLDQKSITAWLDVRNKAAHGRYDEYVDVQVSLLIAGVRDFLTRVKA